MTLPPELEKAKEQVERKLQIFKDPKFVFNEEEHRYFYDGVEYDSVTTYLKGFKEPFLRDYWATRKAEERGITAQEVKKEWEDKANAAGEFGTKVHKWIENFMVTGNDTLPDDPDLKERCVKFLDIYNDKLSMFLPLESELMLFSHKWKLAGTVDQPLLLWDTKKKSVLFVIGDWKTNEDFKHDEHPKGKYKKLLRPFASLYENHHNEYSIQISLYRLIIEEQAGIETHSGFLCHIGPDGPAKIYPALDLREALKIYLDHNRLNETKDIFDID